MPEILLIQPPIRDFYITAKRTIPYGLACIAASLMEDGFSVGILDALATSKSRALDLPLEMSHLRDFYSGPDISPFSLFIDFKHFGYSFDYIGEMVKRSGAFLIGISSLFTAYSDEAIKTAEIVKRYHPEALVVLGGHHPTEMPENVLSNRCVDFVLRGDGEISMRLLARAVRDGTPLESIPGIGFRKADGGIFLNPPTSIEDLNHLPYPALELIDTKFYQRKKRPSAVIVASRGCPVGCSYCSIGGAAWSRFRLKDIDRVMDEMERAVDGVGARFIDFEDENISFNKKWFLALLEKIKRRFSGYGLELRAMNGLFPPTLDEDVVREMKEAGFSALNLSLCTTCKGQLKKFRRPDVRADFERALQYASKYGLETVGYIIVGAPGQRAEDSVIDLLYLTSRKVLAGVSVFYPAPGSADFERCRAQNLLPVELSLMRSTALPISDTTTREESATVMRLGRILNFIKSLSPEEMEQVLMRADAESITRDLNADSFWVNGTCGTSGRSSAPVPSTIERRREIGKLFLASFFHDGKIRGISPEGKTFEHQVSDKLCLQFRDGCLRIFTPF
jgi:anaerobic magnesium-protoporphyrin IX monomethyl ester cyclase